MHFSTFAAALVALAVSGSVLAAPTPSSSAVSARDDDWTEYATEEECHAAGWEVCRRYASGPGTFYWVGFPGPAPVERPKFDTQEECEALYDFCLGYKRADGHWVWTPADWEGKRSLAARDDDWTEYATEEECHAAGWEVCRRYASGPGTFYWVGFPGPVQPTPPKFDTKEECEAIYGECIGYKRAAGYWVWIPVEWNGKRSLAVRDDEWTEYETEEECHAAGWEVCRRYASGPGTSYWVGFPGPAQPETPKFPTQEACEAVYDFCLGYKRANGTWVWFPVEDWDEEEGVEWPGKRTAERRDDNWPEYETEEACHAAGWEVCRRYATGPGTSVWVGFSGPAQPELPKFDTKEECEALYGECLGFKRAAGNWVWFPVDWE